MNLHNLKPAEGSIKKSKRIGRGQGSGKGGTSTKGHKGAQSRSGYKSKIGNEGGQMPLYRRVPKFGFKNINRIEYKVVNISKLQDLSENAGISVFNPELFQNKGLVSKNHLVKILGQGELKNKIDVTAHSFSKNAIKAIESAGGVVTKIENK
ncbi:MAG: 50S ribosomal protein L15 [Bacteroidales bacterium]|nr:50S ribosomal protein L15 [Bacteroidales bacterium]